MLGAPHRAQSAGRFSRITFRKPGALCQSSDMNDPNDQASFKLATINSATAGAIIMPVLTTGAAGKGIGGRGEPAPPTGGTPPGGGPDGGIGGGPAIELMLLFAVSVCGCSQ